MQISCPSFSCPSFSQLCLSTYFIKKRFLVLLFLHSCLTLRHVVWKVCGHTFTHLGDLGTLQNLSNLIIKVGVKRNHGLSICHVHVTPRGGKKMHSSLRSDWPSPARLCSWKPEAPVWFALFLLHCSTSCSALASGSSSRTHEFPVISLRYPSRRTGLPRGMPCCM